MPKSQIIIDAVEDLVPLDKSLTRLMVLAKDVKNQELGKWAKKELSGYKGQDELPLYRRSHSDLLVYSGINGGFQVNNVPLPVAWLAEENRRFCDIRITDGIKYIIDNSSSKTTLRRDLTMLAGDVSKASEGMVTCTSIYQVIPQTIYLSILYEVKNMMIDALCGLEDKYGNLDKLGIDISKKSIIQVESNNAELNRSVLSILLNNQGENSKQPWYAKIGWNFIVPIITAIIGAVVAALLVHVLRI